MDQSYINMIFSLFMTIISGTLGLFGKYLSKYERDLAERMAKQDGKMVGLSGKLEDLRKDLNHETLNVQRNFVTKDEYISMVSKIDSKLDRTLEAIHEVDKQLAQVIAKGEANE